MEHLDPDDDDDDGEESSSDAEKDTKDKKKDKKDKNDDSSSDSSSDSDSSSSLEVKDDKGKVVDVEEASLSAKAKAAAAKKKGKHCRRPLVPLDDLPKSVSCPLVWWDAQKIFKLACTDKLSHWIVLTPQGNTCKASIFEKRINELQANQDLHKLPWQEVVAKCKACAETLEAWTNRTKSWKAPTDDEEFDLDAERQQLEADFQAFDKAVEGFAQYERTLQQAEVDNKLDQKDSKSKRTATEAKLYLALRCQQLPEGIAKVGNYYV